MNFENEQGNLTDRTDFIGLFCLPPELCFLSSTELEGSLLGLRLYIFLIAFSFLIFDEKSIFQKITLAVTEM